MFLWRWRAFFTQPCPAVARVPDRGVDGALRCRPAPAAAPAPTPTPTVPAAGCSGGASPAPPPIPPRQPSEPPSLASAAPPAANAADLATDWLSKGHLDHREFGSSTRFRGGSTRAPARYPVGIIGVFFGGGQDTAVTARSEAGK